MAAERESNMFDFTGDLIPSNSSRRAHISSELERHIRTREHARPGGSLIEADRPQAPRLGRIKSRVF